MIRKSRQKILVATACLTFAAYVAVLSSVPRGRTHSTSKPADPRLHLSESDVSSGKVQSGALLQFGQSENANQCSSNSYPTFDQLLARLPIDWRKSDVRQLEVVLRQLVEMAQQQPSRVAEVRDLLIRDIPNVRTEYNRASLLILVLGALAECGGAEALVTFMSVRYCDAFPVPIESAFALEFAICAAFTGQRWIEAGPYPKDYPVVGAPALDSSSAVGALLRMVDDWTNSRGARSEALGYLGTKLTDSKVQSCFLGILNGGVGGKGGEVSVRNACIGSIAQWYSTRSTTDQGSFLVLARNKLLFDAVSINDSVEFEKHFSIWPPESPYICTVLSLCAPMERFQSVVRLLDAATPEGRECGARILENYQREFACQGLPVGRIVESAFARIQREPDSERSTFVYIITSMHTEMFHSASAEAD